MATVNFYLGTKTDGVFNDAFGSTPFLTMTTDAVSAQEDFVKSAANESGTKNAIFKTFFPDVFSNINNIHVKGSAIVTSDTFSTEIPLGIRYDVKPSDFEYLPSGLVRWYLLNDAASDESSDSNDDIDDSNDHPDFNRFEISVGMLDSVIDTSTLSIVDNIGQPVALKQISYDTFSFSYNYVSYTIQIVLSEFDPTSSEELKVFAVYDILESSHTVRFLYEDSNGSIQECHHIENVAQGTSLESLMASTIIPIPQRSIGYWEYEWDVQGIETVTSDLDIYAKFIPASFNIHFNANEAENIDYSELSCKWDSLYPELPEIPIKDGKTCYGIYLRDVRSHALIIKCYSNSTVGLVQANQSVLGSETIPLQDSDDSSSDSSDSVEDEITVTALELFVVWDNNSLVEDITGLREKIGIVPTPFASDPTATIEIEKVSDTEVNFETGFPPSFAKPIVQDDGSIDESARVISRKMVNTLGNIGSQEQFFEQCGGYHTFNPAVSDSIKGYPRNALLKYYDVQNNVLRTVRSLRDDNDSNFVADPSLIDGINWAYADDNPVVGIEVDYSDYIDLSNTLFVETGTPDLYEVPFDAFLQFYAVYSIDCNCLVHPESDDVSVIWSHNKESGEKEYEPVNAMFFTPTGELAYIDVYNNEETRFHSVPISVNSSIAWYSSASNWVREGEETEQADFHHFKQLSPLCAAIGSLVLSAGDKIRIRHYGRNAEFHLTEAKNVANKMVFTDQILKHIYQVKFANLYRRRCVV